MLKMTALCAIVVFSWNSVAGPKLSYKDPSGKKSMTMTFDKDRMKVDLAKNGKSETSFVFNDTVKEMRFFDHKQKEYFILDKKKAKELIETINSAMKNMEMMMATLPDNMKNMVKEKMKFDMPAKAKKLDLKKKASDVKVGSWKTTHYQMMADSKPSGELWITTYKNLNSKKSDFKAMKGMMNFVRDIGKQVSFLSADQMGFSAWDKIDGWPVKSVAKNNSDTYILNSVSQGQVPAQNKIPEGYKEKSLGF